MMSQCGLVADPLRTLVERQRHDRRPAFHAGTSSKIVIPHAALSETILQSCDRVSSFMTRCSSSSINCTRSREVAHFLAIPECLDDYHVGERLRMT